MAAATDQRLARLVMTRLSRITIRLLAFNVLLVFLPAAGVLVLDTYEQHLLAAQERTMSQEGRLLAAALGATIEDARALTSTTAERIIVNLGRRHQARLRVVDSRGNLLADSAALGPRRNADGRSDAEIPPTVRRSTLYRVASFPIRVLRSLGEPRPQPALDPYEGQDWLLGSEIRAALAGRYGAETRVSPGEQRSVTLYVAIPVRCAGDVIGAVLVSQSTARILGAMYAVRLDVFRVFLASLAAAVVLSLLMATTIARPLARLRRQAEAILDRRGRLRGGFAPSGRRDEIGDLERALAELTRRLEAHVSGMESFTSDLSHEFKNPLAAIRNATEMALEIDDPEERARFLTMIQRDVARMERLLTGVLEVSRIDARLDEEERETVVLDELVAGLVEGFRLRTGSAGPRLLLAIADHGLAVRAAADRLTQVFENLVANAIGFTPAGGAVRVTVEARGSNAVATVADDGPGVPEEHLERVFSRFFSYRPREDDRDRHAGLGLAIVRAIVEGYGGTVTAGNRPGGGAVFTVTLPLARSGG